MTYDSVRQSIQNWEPKIRIAGGGCWKGVTRRLGANQLHLVIDPFSSRGSWCVRYGCNSFACANWQKNCRAISGARIPIFFRILQRLTRTIRNLGSTTLHFLAERSVSLLGLFPFHRCSDAGGDRTLLVFGHTVEAGSCQLLYWPAWIHDTPIAKHSLDYFITTLRTSATTSR